MKIFRGIEQRLVTEYGADDNATDPARVLRVPGFYHQKDPTKTFLVRVTGGTERIHAWEEITAAFPPIVSKRRAPALNTSVYDNIRRELADLPALMNALSFICSDDRKTWAEVGMALKHELGEAGFHLFSAWSATSRKFDPADTMRVWSSFDHERKEKPVTIGSVYALSKERMTAAEGNEFLQAQRTKRFSAMSNALSQDQKRPTTKSTVEAIAEKAGATLQDNDRPKSIMWPVPRSDGSPNSKDQRNIEAFLDANGIQLHYDEFAREIRIEGFHSYRVLDDHALVQLKMAAARVGLNPTSEFFQDALIDLALSDRRHPLKDDLMRLSQKWDGESRIDTWLIDFAGAADNALNRAIGPIVLKAAVLRVFQPGVKFDFLLVLQGPQGGGKSTLIKMLASPAYFDDCLTLGLSAQEVMQHTAGKWILEISELGGSRRENEAIKAMLSRTTDRSTLKYDKFATEAHRSFIMVGTTNREIIHQDETGGRRYWPVEVGKIKLSEFSEVRDQILGEAVARALKEGEEGLKLPKNLWPEAADIQRRKAADNPISEILSKELEDVDGQIDMESLYGLIGLGGDAKSQRKQHHQVTISETMKQLGWTRTRFRPDNASRTYGYEKKVEGKPTVRWEVREGVLVQSGFGNAPPGASAKVTQLTSARRRR